MSDGWLVWFGFRADAVRALFDTYCGFFGGCRVDVIGLSYL